MQTATAKLLRNWNPYSEIEAKRHGAIFCILTSAICIATHEIATDHFGWSVQLTIGITDEHYGQP